MRLDKLGLGCFLFAYGALVHLAWIDANPLLNHRTSLSMGFAGYAFTEVWGGIAGGLLVAWLMLPLAWRPAVARGRHGGGFVLRAAGRAVIATVLTLESFWVAVSVGLTLRPSHYAAPPVWGFLAAFIGVQTYGASVVVDSVPFALCYGAVAGVLLRRLRAGSDGG